MDSSASYSRSGLPVQNSTSLVPRCAPYPLFTHQTTTTIHRLTLRSRNPPDASFYSPSVPHKSLATPPPTTRKTCKSTPALTVPPSRSHDNTVHTPHRRTRPTSLLHRTLTNNIEALSGHGHLFSKSATHHPLVDTDGNNGQVRLPVKQRTRRSPPSPVRFPWSRPLTPKMLIPRTTSTTHTTFGPRVQNLIGPPDITKKALRVTILSEHPSQLSIAYLPSLNA
jgi:hypothetical protein